MKSIRTQDAVGHALIHDLVRIVIGEVKDTPFRRGHVITEEDIPKLLDLGQEHIFVMEPEDEGFLHEEDVARALYNMAGGENMHGRFEFVSLQVMEKATDVIVKIAELNTNV